MPPKRKAKASVSKSKANNTSTEDFAKLKVAELRAECNRLGIDDTGTKVILVKRLQENAEDDVPTKQIKQEEQDEDVVDSKPSMKEKLKALAEAEKSQRKQRAIQIDSHCPITGKIVDDYDCMLNQTNIGANNNKYYVIQMIQSGKKFYVWTRWGRVGEPGQNAMKGPSDLDSATKEFEKKFKDKTKNNWSDRDNFQSKPGKYTMLEMDTADENETAAMEEKLANLDSVDASPIKNSPSKTKPCSLDKNTETLMKLIFSQDMFNDALIKLNLDVKKMPLGKLSKIQISKGFEVLDEIEAELDAGRTSKLSELTSRFYTLIPHNFGRQRPPIINNHEVLRLKMDMLLVLGDIEIAQSLKKEQTVQVKEELPDHPYDVNYKMLSTDLVPVDKSSDEYKAIEKYTTATKPSHVKSPLMNVWKVCRHGEEQRFAEHDNIKNRRLLWHGTNIAVVVAILKGGLRIMPHSGGRVGKGLYFASEHGKSYYYVSPSSCGTGIMFLNEVALGNEHYITKDDSSLKSPPKGFDSVVAKGMTEPDPAKDLPLEFDGKTVHIPQGSPKKQPQYKNSYFSQSEYLIYKENQCRIRYLLTMKY